MTSFSLGRPLRRGSAESQICARCLYRIALRNGIRHCHHENGHSAKLETSGEEVGGGARRVLGAGGGLTPSAHNIDSSKISAQKCQPSSRSHSTNSLGVILRSLFGNQPFGWTGCRLLIARTMREPRRIRMANLARCGSVRSGKGSPAANAFAAASMAARSASHRSKTPSHHEINNSGSRSIAL